MTKSEVFKWFLIYIAGLTPVCAGFVAGAFLSAKLLGPVYGGVIGLVLGLTLSIGLIYAMKLDKASYES